MLIRILPLLTGLLPIVAIHLSLFIAINAGTVPACVPYIDGCTSISATGRYEPAAFVFKPAMIIEAVLMSAYWIASVTWLRSLAPDSMHDKTSDIVIVSLGTAGAVALVVYVTFLGTDTPLYDFMRRFGIYLYFLFTVVAQICLAQRTIAVARRQDRGIVLRVSRIQLWLALVPFALGALNLILKWSLDEAKIYENMIEWIFALLMHIYIALSWMMWRATGFSIEVRTT